jgi:hypothetical protein
MKGGGDVEEEVKEVKGWNFEAIVCSGLVGGGGGSEVGSYGIRQKVQLFSVSTGITNFIDLRDTERSFGLSLQGRNSDYLRTNC